MIPIDLIAHAADLWDVSDGAITSHTRGGVRLTEARQAVAFVLRQHDYSLTEIGAILHRDHSTIIYSIKRAEALADKPRFAWKLRALLAAAADDTQSAPARRQPLAGLVLVFPEEESYWQHWWTKYAFSRVRGRTL